MIDRDAANVVGATAVQRQPLHVVSTSLKFAARLCVMLVGSAITIDKPNAESETVAIDWAAIGLSPAGADSGNLVGSGFTWGRGEADRLRNIEGEIFESYCQGLEDAGWNHPSDLTTELSEPDGPTSC